MVGIDGEGEVLLKEVSDPDGVKEYYDNKTIFYCVNRLFDDRRYLARSHS